MAIDFLNLPLEENKEIPIFLIHPFFETKLLPIHNENGNIEFINVMQSEENHKKAIEYYKSLILEADDVYHIIMLMRNADKRTFFLHIKDYLSEKDFSVIWRNIWINTEFQHRDINVSIAQMKKIFKQADMKYMMSDKEIQMFENLPEKVTVYRGFNCDKYYKALSWTTDKEIADRFSKRFNSKGIIFRALIDKKYIYGFFADELEVIVDYNKLENIEKI